MSQISKPFIVAELSASHNGSLERALAIVDAAADAGADAVKLQTWTPDTMCVDRSYVVKTGAWAGRKLFDLYREAWLPWEWHKPIFDRCAERGIECFSAPFDKASVDFLETLGCPRYKIASFELVDFELIRYAASKGKPMILSTGMATREEILAAVRAIDQGNVQANITVLKCTSAYPSDASDANLSTMHWTKNQLLCNIGVSDHSPGLGVAVAAAAMGADMIEKHLTLSRADGGLDAGFSMEPHEFKQMVIECRRAAAAIGTVKYGCGPNESTDLRRSLYFKRDMKMYEKINADDICTARPALGMDCNDIELVLNCCAVSDIKAGSPITRDWLFGKNK